MASHKFAKNAYLAPSLTAQLPVDFPLPPTYSILPS